MEEFLSKMTGQGIDVYCGNARLRGEVLKAAGGILYLKDDEGQLCYVVIEKIVAVWEAKDSEHRAGFVAGKTQVSPR